MLGAAVCTDQASGWSFPSRKMLVSSLSTRTPTPRDDSSHGIGKYVASSRGW
jgi:hypothetical protein